MILVDDRECASNRSTDRAKDIAKFVDGRVDVVVERLQFGDVAFKGNGPTGDVLLGVELKSVQDCLQCIESARFASHQLPGLVAAYDRVYLVVEGVYRAGPAGVLQVERWEGKHKVWKHANPFTRNPTMWTTLEHWLRSISELAGVTVIVVPDRQETARWVAATWEWWQKPWSQHTTLRSIQKPVGQFHKFTLVEKVAAVLPGIGYERAIAVGKQFCCVRHMLGATKKAWCEVEGIGKVTAKKVSDAIAECKEEK